MRLAALGLAVAALSSSCSGCRKTETEMVVAGQAVPVRVNAARLGTITDTLTASGTLRVPTGAAARTPGPPLPKRQDMTTTPPTAPLPHRRGAYRRPTMPG